MKVLLCGLIIFLFWSCQKSQVGNTQRDGVFLRGSGYLPIHQVDSALIVWSNGRRSMHLRDSQYYLPADSLPPNEQTFHLQLYSKAHFNFYTVRWDQWFTRDFRADPLLLVQAPAHLEDDSWLPRIILQDQAGLRAWCGLRPGDAAFGFTNIDTVWKKLVVERSYWKTGGGIQKLAGGVWQGQHVLNAQGYFSDSSFFHFLPAQLNGRAWNHVEVDMLFTDPGQMQMRGLFFSHTLH